MSTHKLSSMILAAAVVCCAIVARGDVFNMGGTRNADGTWTGMASLETVPVGNVGNTADTAAHSGNPAGQGAVSYNYNIGKYEVTAGQYTEFLNAVAHPDAYGLYNTSMWSSSYGCKIQQTGSSGSYTYSVAADYANRPVNYVSWGDSARFANWLHNGQPTGIQNLSTTEDGAYYLNGATTAAQLLAVTRKTNWKWAITSEDEWFKSAFHKNDGATGNYFIYPTSNDSEPSNVLGTPTDPGNNATFYTGSYTIGSPYYRTEVGAHENSDSPYGTFDQGGNVWEWNEAIIGSSRGLRGGSFSVHSHNLLASSRSSGSYADGPAYESYIIGFRVASVPEPGSLILLVSGVIAALILWKRRK